MEDIRYLKQLLATYYEARKFNRKELKLGDKEYPRYYDPIDAGEEIRERDIQRVINCLREENDFTRIAIQHTLLNLVFFVEKNVDLKKENKRLSTKLYENNWWKNGSDGTDSEHH
ncbi:MAG: hypothetical protein Q7S74_00435 [Nanoarchaeota archaeon]|nr:hypothetical protein [Nanoarchaeota archaeon]